jgi:transcriptional regulator with XRE-family HTH domain
MKANYTKVQEAAEDRGVTISALGRLAGVDPSVLSALKRRGTCHPATVRRLADALGVSVAYLADRGEK